jgi:hypothetical protein
MVTYHTPAARSAGDLSLWWELIIEYFQCEVSHSGYGMYQWCVHGVHVLTFRAFFCLAYFVIIVIKIIINYFQKITRKTEPVVDITDSGSEGSDMCIVEEQLQGSIHSLDDEDKNSVSQHYNHG